MLAELEETIIEEPGEERMPSFNHSLVCAEVIEQLNENKEFKALPELTLDIDKDITPDISVYFRKDIKPNFLKDFPKYPAMPVLAIEVISASQNIQTLLEKAEMLVKNGVKAVWTIEPFTQTIFVTDAGGAQIFHNQEIASEDITVNFKKIFS